MNAVLLCPLCGNDDVIFFHRDQRREYHRCARCALVFVPPEYYLSPQAERAEYDLHQNRVDDAGYRRFLSRLVQPLLQRLPDGASGLDFGCGPGPALAAMMREAGCEMALYDAFYYPGTAPLQRQYQFVTATEVVEHLHQPGAELSRLWQLLLPGAYLGVMTKLVRDQQAFSSWHYKSDPTHVCFFSEQTWVWWAAGQGAALTRIGADVMLLQRPWGTSE